MTYVNTLDDILAAMAHHGGSFMQALAKTYWVADRQNRARIEATWADEFRRYDAFATDLKAHGAAPRLF
jgi:enamine deaminase RidA (YjgF/YER057c/UK114 family)